MYNNNFNYLNHTYDHSMYDSTINHEHHVHENEFSVHRDIDNVITMTGIPVLDSTYLHVIEFKRTDSKIIYHNFTNYKSEFKINDDGMYVIHQFKLPNEHMGTMVEEFSVYPNSIGYNSDFKEVSINTFVNQIDNLMHHSNITHEKKVIFNFEILNSCYKGIVLNLLGDITTHNCYSKKTSSDIYLKKDMLEMSIEAIKYMVENEEYIMALNTLNDLLDCNGLCSESDSRYSNIKNCNCNV